MCGGYIHISGGVFEYIYVENVYAYIKLYVSVYAWRIYICIERRIRVYICGECICIYKALRECKYVENIYL